MLFLFINFLHFFHLAILGGGHAYAASQGCPHFPLWTKETEGNPTYFGGRGIPQSLRHAAPAMCKLLQVQPFTGPQKPAKVTRNPRVSRLLHLRYDPPQWTFPKGSGPKSNLHAILTLAVHLETADGGIGGNWRGGIGGELGSFGLTCNQGTLDTNRWDPDMWALGSARDAAVDFLGA